MVFAPVLLPRHVVFVSRLCDEIVHTGICPLSPVALCANTFSLKSYVNRKQILLCLFYSCGHSG